jgi:hypothetical protein
LGVEQVAYNPITSISNGTSYEFKIPGNGDSYKDLSSIYLRLLVEISPSIADEPKKESSDKVSVVNNLLHSLFKQCTVSFNNILVSQDNDYHYKAFFQTILNYGGDASNTHLKTTGWVLDKKHLDSTIITDNPAHGERNSWFESSSGGFNKKVELYGKLHIDLFNQSRFLLNNVDILINLNKEKSSFYMMERATDNSDIKILEANLFIDHIHVNPAILLAHHRMLSKTTAKYPYKKVLIRQYTVNAGTANLNLDNIIMGQKPNILLFSMVTNNAYCGSRSKNPYFLQDFGLQQFAIFVDGKQIPSKPINMVKTDANITSRAYSTLFDALGIRYSDKGHQITKELFDTCYFMLAFDLTADHSYSTVCMNPMTNCSIRIEGSFRENLKESISCLIVFELDGLMEIDENRNVKITP